MKSIPALRLTLLALFLVIGHWSSVIGQGPLTPPGAPAPTMKTLDQIDAKLEKRTPISSLPFTISTRGSYYLTGNLTGVSGQHGITIDADHVTLDLNGFDIAGPGGGTLTGIRVINSRADVTIRSGSVHGWSAYGVAGDPNSNTDLNVEKVRVFGNGTGGILLGNYGSARQCESRGNLGTGILAGVASRLIDCISSNNTGATSDGFFVNSFSVVQGCVAIDNGADGFQVGNATTVRGCVAENNGAIGYRFSGACTLRDCSAQSNGTLGFSASGSRNSLSNCAAGGNGGVGISAATECVLSNCTASGNGGNGLVVGDWTALDTCVASSNTGNGINASDGAAIHNCSASNNTNNGIVVGDGATITSCTADGNRGTAGISAGFAATIIGCNARNNTSTAVTSAGILTATDCFISQCVASGNTSTATPTTPSSGVGIFTTSACTIERCTVRLNKGDGIRFSSLCYVTANLCDGNGGAGSAGDGAGAHATGSDNRIEGNTASSADRGIDVDGLRNVVVRNTAHGNTANYVIIAGNSVGAIVVPGASVAINGNGALASSLGTTDPWANLSK